MSASVSKRLYLKDLPDATHDNDIIDCFREYGTVVEVKMMSGQAYAFVEYATQESAQIALEAFSQGVTFMGRKIAVEYAHPLRKDISEGDRPSSHRLYLGDLPIGVTAKEVRSALTHHGPILAFKMKQGSKYAFVEYASIKDAASVLETFRKYEFLGKRISIDYAHGTERKFEIPLQVESEPERKGRQLARPRARHRLIVHNIPKGMCWQELKDFGRLSGMPVAYCNMDKDRPSRGFLEFCSMKDAQIALRELDGKLMGGTKVSVCLPETLSFQSNSSGEVYGASSPPRFEDITNARTHSRRTRSRSPERRNTLRYDTMNPYSDWIPSSSSSHYDRRDGDVYSLHTRDYHYATERYREREHYDPYYRTERPRDDIDFYDYEQYARYRDDYHDYAEDYYRRHTYPESRYPYSY